VSAYATSQLRVIAFVESACRQTVDQNRPLCVIHALMRALGTPGMHR